MIFVALIECLISIYFVVLFDNKSYITNRISTKTLFLACCLLKNLLETIIRITINTSKPLLKYRYVMVIGKIEIQYNICENIGQAA